MDLSEASSEIAAGCYATAARRLARAVTRAYDDHLRPLGIKASQLTLLTVIAEGDTRPVEIGTRLDMEKSTVARGLALMERRGWVSVESEGAGRRVSLTSAGQELLVAGLEPWRSATAEVAERLDSDGLLPMLATQGKA